MTVMEFVKLYLIALPIFFIIDMFWLGVVAKGFYRKHLGYLMAPRVNWPAAIIFYLTFIAGVLLFVVIPARNSDSLWTAVVMGALFGFFTYATYDLTNLATVKDWPLVVTIVDLCWGMALSGSVAVLTFLISNALKI